MTSSLTTAQLLTLKNDFKVTRANTVYSGKTLKIHLDESNYTKIAEFYNNNYSPAELFWNPQIGIEDILSNIVWSEFISLSQGQRDAFNALTQGGCVDATNANIRTGFASIFVNPSATFTNLQNLSRRNATNLEKLFETSGGSLVSSVFGYKVTSGDILLASLTI